MPTNCRVSPHPALLLLSPLTLSLRARAFPKGFAETDGKVDEDDDAPGAAARGSYFVWVGKDTDAREKRERIVKAAFYAAQVFYSFFIMLLFMTYNGWVMLAVAAGAFLGYIAFGGGSATKSVACH